MKHRVQPITQKQIPYWAIQAIRWRQPGCLMRSRVGQTAALKRVSVALLVKKSLTVDPTTAHELLGKSAAKAGAQQAALESEH